MNPRFLTAQEVLELHRQAIEMYGGLDGIRDSALLESAVGAPQAGTQEGYLYQSIPQMAAVYWFAVTRDHPFLDGNKRVGLLACATFLAMNGYELNLSNERAVELSLALAEGTLELVDLVDVVAEACRPLR